MSQLHARRTYMFLGTARSQGVGTGHPEGEQHAVIAFALAERLEVASRAAEEHFAGSGWSHVVFHRAAELDPETLNGTDPKVVLTYEECLARGVAGIVFSDSIESTPI
jgi:hypothetical protein